MDDVTRQDSPKEYKYAQPADLPKVPPHLRPLEEKRAAIAEFHRAFPCDEIAPGSLTSLLEEEREAVRHIYPNSLVDLGKAGIIKVRVFREDGSSYFLPEEKEAYSASLRKRRLPRLRLFTRRAVRSGRGQRRGVRSSRRSR